MKFTKQFAAAVLAVATAATFTGCTAGGTKNDEDEDIFISSPTTDGEEDFKEEITPPEIPPATPAVKKISYISVTASGVNIRSGAGAQHAVRGVAEKSTLYSLDGEEGGWFKTGYKNKTAYISGKYCDSVEMTASEDERIEAVIAEGAKLLGTAYVYGAIRYHDGNGRLLKNFTTSAFDCSSLMQYMFYMGAGYYLQVTTRTQVSQGKTVGKSELKRGDLMFFTNESRKNNTGVERVGHVAMYLGGNWILHTASDYAKIEQISAKRWSFFIQGQRIF